MRAVALPATVARLPELSLALPCCTQAPDWVAQRPVPRSTGADIRAKNITTSTTTDAKGRLALSVVRGAAKGFDAQQNAAYGPSGTWLGAG